jgi:hypothetical protein
VNLIDLLALGLIVAFFIDWSAFAVVFAVERRNRGIRTLTDRKWASLGIALGSSALVVLSVAYYLHANVGPTLGTVLLVVPVYVLSLVNVVFLYLTARGKW